jgi:hypothetical protein
VLSGFDHFFFLPIPGREKQVDRRELSMPRFGLSAHFGALFIQFTIFETLSPLHTYLLSIFFLAFFGFLLLLTAFYIFSVLFTRDFRLWRDFFSFFPGRCAVFGSHRGERPHEIGFERRISDSNHRSECQGRDK